MGQILYHKIFAEITGPDGRDWTVTVEPMVDLEDLPAGEPQKYQVNITRVVHKGASSAPGLTEPTTYVLMREPIRKYAMKRTAPLLD